MAQTICRTRRKMLTLRKQGTDAASMLPDRNCRAIRLAWAWTALLGVVMEFRGDQNPSHHECSLCMGGPAQQLPPGYGRASAAYDQSAHSDKEEARHGRKSPFNSNARPDRPCNCAHCAWLASMHRCREISMRAHRGANESVSAI